MCHSTSSSMNIFFQEVLVVHVVQVLGMFGIYLHIVCSLVVRGTVVYLDRKQCTSAPTGQHKLLQAKSQLSLQKSLNEKPFNGCTLPNESRSIPRYLYVSQGEHNRFYFLCLTFHSSCAAAKLKSHSPKSITLLLPDSELLLLLSPLLKCFPSPFVPVNIPPIPAQMLLSLGSIF